MVQIDIIINYLQNVYLNIGVSFGSLYRRELINSETYRRKIKDTTKRYFSFTIKQTRIVCVMNRSIYKLRHIDYSI